MSISGLVVHTLPARAPEVRERLTQYDGVEVHAVTEDGKMVITVDIPDDHRAADTLMDLQKQDGVLSASLIYTHFEPHARNPQARNSQAEQGPADKELAR